MRKLLIVLNVLFPALMIAGATCYSIFGLLWLKWLMGLCFVIQAAVNVFYLIKVNKNKKWFAIFISAALLISYFAAMLAPNSVIWVLILFAITCALLYMSLICVVKFSFIDLIFGACIALPVAMLTIFADFLGFANVWVKILIVVYMIMFSMLVGKSLSNLISHRRATESVQFSATILFFIANFVIVCNSFSMVSHYILIVFTAFYAIANGLYAYSIFQFALAEDFEQEKVTFKSEVKRSRWQIVAIALAMLFIGYSTVITFDNFNIANARIYKEQFLASVGENLNIPLIEVNTQNNEFPTSKEEYVNASFAITNCENEEDNFSVEMADKYGDEGSVGIRLRGNSTKTARKKPFRIKFDEKKSFFGLKKNKSWVLLADYYDQSYMRNYTAFSIADNFDNLKFTPTPHHVALVLNGSFQGLYLLCEQIDEKGGRTGVDEDFDINVDKEFPFLVEMDVNAWLEGETGVDNFYVPDFQPVEIKYPEADERYATSESDVVYDYIYEYVNAVFYTLKTGETTEVSFRDTPVALEDLVEINSAVDYYLMTEIMHNTDSIGKSIYLHKTKDGKMQFGPIWDFDFSMASDFEVPYRQSFIESANNLVIAKSSAIYSKLLRNETFYNAVVARYNALSHTILETVEDLKTYKATIDNVASIDARMWHGKTGQFQYDMQYDYVRLYLQDRVNYLNYAFSLDHTSFLNI